MPSKKRHSKTTPLAIETVSRMMSDRGIDHEVISNAYIITAEKKLGFYTQGPCWWVRIDNAQYWMQKTEDVERILSIYV